MTDATRGANRNVGRNTIGILSLSGLVVIAFPIEVYYVVLPVEGGIESAQKYHWKTFLDSRPLTDIRNRSAACSDCGLHPQSIAASPPPCGVVPFRDSKVERRKLLFFFGF